MAKRIVRTARRMARIAGFGAESYIVYGKGESARGPYAITAAGRLAAARDFHLAPASNGAVLYANDRVIARS